MVWVFSTDLVELQKKWDEQKASGDGKNLDLAMYNWLYTQWLRHISGLKREWLDACCQEH